MTLANLNITPADRLDLPALTELWNLAYSGYAVPLNFSSEMLQRHIDRSGASLAISRVLWREGVACGISLAALRGERGYLAGFGIGPEARRQGLGALLLEAQVDAWHQQGLKQARLEVMEANPARHLYAQAGFVAQRRLLLLQGALSNAAQAAVAALQPVPLDTLSRLHDRLNAASPPTWRREWTTVRQAVQAPGAAAWQLTGGGAYAVVLPTPSATVLLDAAASDAGAAAALWAALAAQHPGARWRLVDEPAQTPLAQAALAAGLQAPLAQVEMFRRFDRTDRPLRSL
jgi:ribosomal protein S18 acetylase RimI-like enzyme